MQENENVAPGSDEYNQQMADKFANQEQLVDGNQPDPVPVTPLPEGGLDKFYNKETGEYDWQNHAKELEYRMKNPQKPNEENITPEQMEAVKQVSNSEAIDIVGRAGLDAKSLQDHLNQNGTLPEEAYAALEKQGLNRQLVDMYVENYNFKANAVRESALNYVGGEQEWNALSGWAAENLTPQEVSRYNELLATNEWKVAMDALRVRRDMAHGEPRLMGGNDSFNGTSFGYRSKAEMKTDMSDPRYTKDPAFRKQVMQKIQSATWEFDAQ